jgi:hypothetical protein
MTDNRSTDSPANRKGFALFGSFVKKGFQELNQ